MCPLPKAADPHMLWLCRPEEDRHSSQVGVSSHGNHDDGINQLGQNMHTIFISFLGPQTSSLKQQKWILPQFWSPEVWNQGVINDVFSPKSLEVDPSLFLPDPHSPRWSLASGITSISASISRWLSSLCFCVSLCLPMVLSLCLSSHCIPLLVRTPVILN